MALKPFPPKNIMLMPNVAMPKALKLANLVRAILNKSGVNVKIFNYNFEDTDQSPSLDDIDLLIVLGGDGSLLRAGHICASCGIPLLGIQTGRLGFLVEINEAEIETKLAKLLNAEYRLEDRMMLKADLYSGSKIRQSWDVINEIVITRGNEVRPIEIRVDLNEGYLTSYISDGMIVSTATGSTGYALAAGGPILPPELRNMLILPIAPHLSLDRAVVLAEGAMVNLYPTFKHQVIISVDGMKPVVMNEDEYVRVQVNEHSLYMVRFGEANYFYRNLAAVMQHNPILGTEKHD